jgi:hypothetical protein
MRNWDSTSLRRHFKDAADEAANPVEVVEEEGGAMGGDDALHPPMLQLLYDLNLGWNQVENVMYETLADAFEKNHFTLEFVQQAALSEHTQSWDDIKETTGIRRGDAMTLQRYLRETAAADEVEEDMEGGFDPYAEETMDDDADTGSPMAQLLFQLNLGWNQVNEPYCMHTIYCTHYAHYAGRRAGILDGGRCIREELLHD